MPESWPITVLMWRNTKICAHGSWTPTFCVDAYSVSNWSIATTVLPIRYKRQLYFYLEVCSASNSDRKQMVENVAGGCHSLESAMLHSIRLQDTLRTNVILKMLKCIYQILKDERGKLSASSNWLCFCEYWLCICSDFGLVDIEGFFNSRLEILLSPDTAVHNRGNISKALSICRHRKTTSRNLAVKASKSRRRHLLGY